MIEPGQTLLHYRIAEKLGEGGMGVVWKAVDTNLDRAVAIKVLPQALAADAERLARFEREAKLLASLDHSNIATVYGLHKTAGEPAGPTFIAMEFIPGEDLAERLARGPLPIDEALAAATQIAEALEAAHDSGVIHRDLKPANVKLGVDGKIKVLDFGLAKAFDADPASGVSASLSPTMTSAGSIVGMILGTAGYMSPEQAKAKPVDRRADIWSFGVLLTEMLTGRRMFDAETVSEIIAQVLMTPIDLDVLPTDTPPAVRRLLGRCLERDPRRRLRDIGEARVLLEDVRSGAATDDTQAPGVAAGMSTGAAPHRSSWPMLLGWVLALLAAAAAIGIWRMRPPVTALAKERLATSILPPPAAGFDIRRGMALSSDGRRLVFPARGADSVRRLWVRDLDSPAARVLDGTAGADAPFWSPDARWVAFFSDEGLKRIEISTGVLETVADAPNRGSGSWGRAGTIVFNGERSDGLSLVPEAGGPVTPIVETDLTREPAEWPQFLPDGRHFIYFVRRYATGDRSGQIRLGSIDGGAPRAILDSNSNALYAEPGYLLWWEGGNLRGQRFDTDRMELVGTSTALIPNVRNTTNNGRMVVTVSDTGLLLYQSGGSDEGSELVLVDRGGNTVRSLPSSGALYGPRLSPDGRHVTLDMSDETNKGDIWTLGLDRGSPERLSFFPEDDTRPRWSPDGTRIVWVSMTGGDQGELWVADARGGAPPRKLVSDPQAGLQTVDWATDDLILVRRSEGPQSDLYVYSIEADTLRPWVATAFQERTASAMPGGAFAAYVSDETGRDEVWVQSFPEGGVRWRVSSAGGDWPAWRADGGEMYFRASDERLMAVNVRWEDGPGGRVPVFDTPEPLFSFDAIIHTDRQYDTHDGKTFLLNRALRETAAEPLTLVQGWAPD